MKQASDLLSPQDLEDLMQACEDSPAGLRNRALIALLAGTGIRISEALAALPEDLDLKKRRLFVRNGKGGKTRTVWVHPDAKKPVRDWLRARKKLDVEDEGVTLFCNLSGEALSSSYVRRMLPQLAETAGIKKRVHSHGLRHAFACKAHQANISLRALQLQFGHSSIATTSSYLERIGLDIVFGEFDRVFGST